MASTPDTSAALQDIEHQLQHFWGFVKIEVEKEYLKPDSFGMNADENEPGVISQIRFLNNIPKSLLISRICEIKDSLETLQFADAINRDQILYWLDARLESAKHSIRQQFGEDVTEHVSDKTLFRFQATGTKYAVEILIVPASDIAPNLLCDEIASKSILPV